MKKALSVLLSQMELEPLEQSAVRQAVENLSGVQLRIMLAYLLSACWPEDLQERLKEVPAMIEDARLCAARFERDEEQKRLQPKARRVYLNAKIHGEIVPQPCAVCGSTYKIAGHHEDYGNPLNVRWLCNSHHHQRHSEIGRLRWKLPTRRQS